MMSDVRYEIKKLHYLLSDFENWHKKIRVGPYVTNTHDDQTDPGWSGWWWNPGPQTSDSQLTMRDLKKRKELLTLIRSTLLSIITLYIIGLSIELIISDHRLTSVCQLD
jgi:hypothetical protein